MSSCASRWLRLGCSPKHGLIKLIFTLLFLTPFSSTQAATLIVPAGGDLQAAINAAQPGDEIVLAAGVTYSGNYVLPVKSGATFITIRSSRCGELPAGVRVSLAQAPLMATLATPNVTPVLSAPVFTHHFRFQCLEFTQGPAVGTWGYNLIQMGEGASYENQKTLDSVPHDFEFDRVIVRARDAQTAVQRGITLNSAATSVTNSYISDIKYPGTEAQGLGGWNGPGPYLIENNFIEAAGINILFGGAATAIPNLVPADIVIRGNTLFKRLDWQGKGYAAKNLFELKNARRVTFTNNTCINSWPEAQTGWAVIFNALADSPQHTIEDVIMSNNVFSNVANGINLRGMDDGDTVARMHRVTIANNLIDGIGAFSGEGKAFQVLNGTDYVTFDHNTVRGTVHDALILDTYPITKHVGLVFTNNLMPHGEYGIFGAGGYFGTAALNAHATGWSCSGNALYAKPTDPAASLYPAGNYFPATESSAVGLTGIDGLPVGANTGSTPPPPPTPTPTPTATPTPTPTPSPTPTPTPTPPITVKLTNPTSGTTYSFGTSPTLAASASTTSGVISRVAFNANTQVLGTFTVSPYSMIWSNPAAGTYTVTATATDNQGGVVTSSPITVKISKALKGVRNGKGSASTLQSSFTASGTSAFSSELVKSSDIDSLVDILNQAYVDFSNERSMFSTASDIDRYLFAALFLAKSSSGMAKQQTIPASGVVDRLNKVDVYLSFIEDLMTDGVISNQSLTAGSKANARVDISISRPDVLPLGSNSGNLLQNTTAALSCAPSNPMTAVSDVAPSNGVYELGGVSVTVGGTAVSLISVSPTAIAFNVPADLPGGIADVIVTSRDGYIVHTTASVSGLNPMIFTQQGDANSTGAIVNSFAFSQGAFSPFSLGWFGDGGNTRLTILASGISTGLANANVSNDISLGNGKVIENYADVVAVEARLADGRVISLPVEFAGSTNLVRGMDQVTIRLTPDLAGAGNVQITVIAGGRRSNTARILMN